MKCLILLAIIFKWILKITSLPKLYLSNRIVNNVSHKTSQLFSLTWRLKQKLKNNINTIYLTDSFVTDFFLPNQLLDSKYLMKSLP